MCWYGQVSASVHGSKRHWIPLQLELLMVVSCPTWVLGIKLPPSARAAHALNLSYIDSPFSTKKKKKEEKRKRFIYFMCMGALPAYVSVYHVCAVPKEAR